MRCLSYLVLAGSLIVGTASFATETPRTGSVDSNLDASEVIVQIFGRMCEYHREDVERALRGFKAIRQVEFVNDHGTVLVQYQPGAETPEQFADAVHRALAAGWHCIARVDRGEGERVASQQEVRP